MIIIMLNHQSLSYVPLIPVDLKPIHLLKIKVHLSKITTENIAVDFNVTGSSDIENFSFGEGILNIDAGLKIWHH